MGQNFGRILMNRNPEDGKNDITTILSRLQDSFVKDKEVETYNEFLDEQWNKQGQGIIGVYKNDQIIIIEDEYDLISAPLIQELSKTLATEFIRVDHSDTAGLSMLKVFDKGELVRMKSFGLENDLQYLSPLELKSVEGLGEPTIYEQNGSTAINIFQSFIAGKVAIEDIAPITIYKRK